MIYSKKREKEFFYAQVIVFIVFHCNRESNIFCLNILLVTFSHAHDDLCMLNTFAARKYYIKTCFSAVFFVLQKKLWNYFLIFYHLSPSKIKISHFLCIHISHLEIVCFWFVFGTHLIFLFSFSAVTKTIK